MSAPGTLVLLSANPIHDTGGGQRSAQLALELLERGWTVVFVAHGEVTETVDLDLRFDHERLVEMTEAEFRSVAGSLDRWRAGLPTPGLSDPAPANDSPTPPFVLLIQVPLPGWDRIVSAVRAAGGVSVYDCVDRWDSELGWGWYDRSAEKRVARVVDLRVASAPALERHLGRLAGGHVHALPNAFNQRIFDPGRDHPRPSDLPGGPVVLYVGALWGGWMDWELVDALARARPDLAFVFVGDHHGEGEELPGNCHFTGLKPQTELPGYLAHARIGLLPWTADDVTQATSPLKVYEYLAMGLPVLGPEIEPLRGLPSTRLASGADDFVAALAEWVPSDPTPASERSAERRAEAAREFAGDHSWAARVDALTGWVAEGPTGRGWGARTWWRRLLSG